MSALTKILIILLTLSSIFLCGIVVTYVANADSWKQQYDGLKERFDAAVAEKESAKDQLDKKKTTYEQHEDQLNKQIDSLNTEIQKVNNELTNVKREKTGLEEKVQSWVSITKELGKTNDNQGKLLEKTLVELKDVKAKQIKQRKELDETVADLIAKNAIIKTLQQDKRRLEQETAGLLNQLDQFRRRLGKETAPIPTVALKGPPPRPAPPLARDVGLKGSVTAVDAKYSLAEISIGAAHGVKQGMKFYVTRGNEFICEILIYDVEAEKAVGDLKRIKYQPKVGDNVTTNL